MKTVTSRSSASASEAGQVVQAEARASASSDGESIAFTHSSASVGEQPVREDGFVSSHAEAEAGGMDFLPEELPGDAGPGAGFIPALEVPASAHVPLGLADDVFGFG